jgi:hypothetical protein
VHSEKFDAVDGAKVEETLAGRSKAAERDGAQPLVGGGVCVQGWGGVSSFFLTAVHLVANPFIRGCMSVLKGEVNTQDAMAAPACNVGWLRLPRWRLLLVTLDDDVSCAQLQWCQ